MGMMCDDEDDAVDTAKQRMFEKTFHQVVRNETMTLRDYFAAKAMQSFTGTSMWGEEEDIQIAKVAYSMADAMLKAKEHMMTSRVHTPEDVKKIQRQWVGLTDDEVYKTLRVYEQDYNWTSFAKAIEAKLKEKNT
jgi:hypothetical protein